MTNKICRRPGEICPVAGVPSADHDQSIMTQFQHAQMEESPQPLRVKLDEPSQTFHLHHGHVIDERIAVDPSIGAFAI